MKSILLKCEKYVSKLLTDELSDKITYHNLKHTQRIAESAKQICKNENLTDDYIETILIATWFYDTGFINSYKNHEEESSKIAESFLIEKEYPIDKVTKIKETILATKIRSNPKNIFEFILIDAIHSHFAEDEYFVICKPLRQELKNINNKTFTDIEWINENIDHLENRHTYYTDYANYNWKAKKDLNLRRLKATIVELESEQTKNLSSEYISTKKKNKAPKIVPIKEVKLDDIKKTEVLKTPKIINKTTKNKSKKPYIILAVILIIIIIYFFIRH